MAFKDENGKITIDEQAAEYDMRRLREAKSQLEVVKDMMTQIQVQASSFSGNTGKVIEQVCSQLINQINQSVMETEEAADTIQKTVVKYQAIDSKLKETIESVRT